MIAAIVATAAITAAQATGVDVYVTASARPLPAARVAIADRSALTDSEGHVRLDAQPGTVAIVVSKDGFASFTTAVTVRSGETVPVTVDLVAVPSFEAEIDVLATRTGRRLDDQPMRVEVLDEEEIREKQLMTPGDIVMMLNEMGGMRVQAAAPALGAANIRIQGMRGRYTRVFSDGLPLFGEDVGAFGLLQIPPSDLARVEVIKGVASSLYGSGALGGVINLVSRRPSGSPQRELIVNRSTRGATDATLWYSTPVTPRLGITLLGGVHGQSRADVNDDAWADLSRYARVNVRPRLFWDDGAGRSVFATVGVMAEHRTGGTMPGRTIGSAVTYVEALDTRRDDGGLVAQTILDDAYVVTARGSFVRQTTRHSFDDRPERDVRQTMFGELTLRRALGTHTVVAGMALERATFSPDQFPLLAYRHTIPGLFAQDDLDVTRWLSVSASTRVDRHSTFGWFVSPRIASLVRRGHWSGRASYGSGFFAPTPIVDETEANGFSRFFVGEPLVAERGGTALFDVTRTWPELTVTATVFRSRIQHPVTVERTSVLLMRNLATPLTTNGVEMLAAWRRPPFAATVTYAYTRAREEDDDYLQDLPLTPRHSAGADWLWNRDEWGRVGFECYYTGRQRLERDPFRRFSRPYVAFGALVERKFGPVRVFVNGENLGDVRQTRWSPLVLPTAAPDGRWTVDQWAPLDGRTINGGVRIAF